jgi:FkbM family methyltransferase
MLANTTKAYLRSIQTFFPALQDTRFKFDRFVRQACRVVHDSDWSAFRLLRVSEGVIFDIGANRGQSIESFRVVLPERSLIAFEPNSHLADKLTKQYKGIPGVQVKAFALGDAAGSKILYVPRYRSWVFDGLASMDCKEAMQWLNAETLKGFDPDRLSCLQLNITVRTLDEFCHMRPAVIKMDTQGTEGKVLAGGLTTIGLTKPIILLESATNEIVDLLKPLAYRPYVFIGNQLVPDRIDAKNVFFLSREHFDAYRA